MIHLLTNPLRQIRAKVLRCTHLKGSLTVEVAFVIPFFLLAAVVVLGLFPLLLVQTQISGALQYASRMAAVSYRDAESSHDVLTLAEGEVLFLKYLNEHGFDDEAVLGGKAGVSLLYSDFSGEYVEMTASYLVDLPIHFGRVNLLPVTQSVKSKKWTGAAEGSATGDGGAEGGIYYVTPTGHAYHSSDNCPYLDLSIHTVSTDSISNMRNVDGHKYYSCSCYNGGGSVYITDYGTEYHSSLVCSSLKRTIYTVTQEELGDRHPCSKCEKGE